MQELELTAYRFTPEQIAEIERRLAAVGFEPEEPKKEHEELDATFDASGIPDDAIADDAIAEQVPALMEEMTAIIRGGGDVMDDEGFEEFLRHCNLPKLN
jgi:hypothetical protein